jgi:hypothetical protein
MDVIYVTGLRKIQEMIVIVMDVDGRVVIGGIIALPC